MSKAVAETPLMKQYNAIKAKYPDAILLFRVGDFYETFREDAVITAKTLDIVLTKRANGSASHIELAGFPHHAMETYVTKLVRAGYRVAVCDQLEDPKQTKTIVKRGVTEIITPGVTFNEQVLQGKKNNYLASLFPYKNHFGMALLDVSTGEFYATEGDFNQIKQYLNTFQPSEILFPKHLKNEQPFHQYNFFYLEDWVFQKDFAYEKLIKQFNTQSLKGFGIEEKDLAIIAAGSILSYLTDDTHHHLLGHITKIQWIGNDNYVQLDGFSIRNLELIDSQHPNGKSLFQTIDNTITHMGGRTLRKWILFPLVNPNLINHRLNVVENLLKYEDTKEKIEAELKGISDIERLLGKLAAYRISPKELGYLRDSLQKVQHISEIVKHNIPFDNIGVFSSMGDILSLLNHTLNEELPVHLNKGNVIKEGISNELDEYRQLLFGGKEYLEQMRLREAERTEIPSLKIDFNNVFGYYIEVRNAHKDKVPEEWIRKQTLVNAERYITEELKEYETKILSAESKIQELEQQLYQELCEKILVEIKALQDNARLIGILDVLNSFAENALKHSYIRPELHDNFSIDIKDGRHPVIENLLPIGESYVSNDIFLDPKQQILMITGPNMSGKSALLRQTALIVLLAQMGSYVPAKMASIGIVDKIWTRVGASDNISQGESTFMVEMNETATIINNLSERSLILLDEIGRGTSTYDGVSIAWAIAEYLHDSPYKPKTLFATHYHELNEMSQTFSGIKNFNVSIKEINGNIIFMRKLIPGGSEHSFGIHVAKLAGMPTKIIRKAEDILQNLEKSRQKPNTKKVVQDNMQLSFFQLDDPILEDIREELLNTDINTLTPVEALMKLNQIKKKIEK